MNTSLKGYTALVTGGTRGIGKAIANRLIKDEAKVIVTGIKPIAETPSTSHYMAIDFSDREALDDFSKKIEGIGIDILINNAGINKINRFEKIDPDDFDLIQQVNVRAPFLLCRSVLPGMKKRRWGRIVNICSIFGIVSKELRASYSTSKFAVDGMTAALAAEVAADGILVNCVSPGFIDTDLTRKILGESGIKELVSKIPIKRLGETEEVAAFVAWLAGPENTYISGQNIAIDGGFTRV